MSTVREKETKTIAYLRSTEIYNDSRASKEIESYSVNNNVLVFGWNRNSESIPLIETDKIKYNFFEKKAKYGSGFKNIFNIIKYNKWLISQIKLHINEIDIIHACDLDTALAARIIAKKYKKKMIYDIYDYYVECHNLGFLKRIVEKIDINIINKSDAVLICTENRREQIAKANPKRVEIIHNSPKIDPCKDQTKNKKINIGYFGILQDDRLLIEISKEIKENKDLVLHIGGFGKYSDYFEDLSKKYKNIIYYGTLKYSEVLENEKKCDVLFATYNPAIANHKYSAPNKVYEAMALNLPIIVCKDTGIDELVIGEKIGCSIEYDSKAFIEMVKQIDKTNFKENYKVFLKKYSWNVMEKKLLEIINTI